jgi:hypothetical protein
VAQSEPDGYYQMPRLAVGGMFSYYHLGYGSRNLLGGTVVVHSNFTYHAGVIGEIHWLELNQEQNVHNETYLAGPRYTFNEVHRWQPYVNALIGNGQFNFPYGDAHGGYLVLAAGGGFDRTINRRWLLRALNFEYQHWPGFTGSSFSQYGVSGGIEYRIW